MGKADLGPASSNEPRAEDLVGRVVFFHEFFDDVYDRRVTTSTSGQRDAFDDHDGDDLPKGWFSWRK